MTTPPALPARRWRKLIPQLALVILALLALAWRTRPDGRLHVFFLETQGDAALIQTPTGRYILIDGGADPAALTAALGQRLPFWRRTLDAVVLTSPDRQHLPGQVAALARYHADFALTPPLTERDSALDEWLRLLWAEQTPIHVAQRNDQFNLGPARLHVLAPGDGASAGMLLRLDYGTTGVVFAHTSAAEDEEALAAAGRLRPTSLVAFPWQRDPHTAFLSALRPSALVLTDGFEADRPVEQTFVERAVGGVALYHEQLNGTIEWISDGRQAHIASGR